MGTTHTAVPALQVENLMFPARVDRVQARFLARRCRLECKGVRGPEIEGKFIKFTVIGVYLEEGVALKYLATKWSCKTAQELPESAEFYMDIVTGPIEKFIQLTFISHLTGPVFSKKAAENCVAYLKSIGSYKDAEEKAIQQFLQEFKNEDFLPGSSVLFTQSPSGSLTLSFSKHNVITKEGNAVIYNKPLSEAYLESVIGQNGVSPAVKKSLATRISELFEEKNGHSVVNGVENGKSKPEKATAAAEEESNPSE